MSKNKPHVDISLYAAKTCLFMLEYYQDLEGKLEGEERAAYAEIKAKVIYTDNKLNE
jgi:hypothetical protein